jgi:hypothetical protein
MKDKETLRDKYSLEEIDFCRNLGIIYFPDEDDEDQHLSVEFPRHNHMCEYCTHFLSKEDGFVLVPMSSIKELMKKVNL